MPLNFIRSLFSGKTFTLTSSGRTDTGKLRTRNEDSFALNPNLHLFFVADGMGGHLGGEVAANMAIEVATSFLPAAELNRAKRSDEECRRLLIRSFRKANHAVVTYGDKHPEVAGLGCTLIGCLIVNRQAHLCHVGDVRGYLLRGNTLRQITTDHSLAAQNEPGEKNIPKNIITRCIGVNLHDDPEHHVFSLKAKDIILLCSDGLWNMVSDEEIKQTIQNATDLDCCCETLVDLANNAGGRDNITVALIKVAL
ncbi:MAG: protein phosphatase 2C domain-containing protein [Desulfobulbaceae bacterium]|jgi:serine/threonine protein phosphatase PrpC|nr:protein phosphatase 2C domain-containing protein [Desulfobulbaceae bacterium]